MLNLIETDCQDYVRLMVEGRVDVTTSPQLQSRILAIFQKKNNLVLDFLNVEYVSSAALRALLIGQKTAVSKGGSMKLVNVGDTVMKVFEMSGFSKILNVEK